MRERLQVGTDTRRTQRILPSFRPLKEKHTAENAYDPSIAHSALWRCISETEALYNSPRSSSCLRMQTRRSGSAALSKHKFYDEFLYFSKFPPDQFTENDFITNYKLHIQAKLFARKLLHVKTNLAIKLFTSCRHEYKHTLALSSTQHSWLSEVIWNWFHF